MNNIAHIIKRDMKRILDGNLLNRTVVQYFYDVEESPGSGEYDPNVESSYPEYAPESGEFNALVHFVQPETSAIRQFAEIRSGDVILDFSADVVLPSAARFVIDGRDYVQKSVGKELAQYWDVVVGGERMMRTLVLTANQ